jgi:F-type H+-transporting ATPase subunit b
MNALEYIILQWFNLALLLAALFLLLKKPVYEFLFGRREYIRLSLEKARRNYEEAQNKYHQAIKKEAQANKDAENLKRSLIETGNFHSAILIKEAVKTAEKIKKEAAARAAYDLQMAKESIAREILGLSFERAGNILKKGVPEEKQIALINSSLEILKNIDISGR